MTGTTGEHEVGVSASDVLPDADYLRAIVDRLDALRTRKIDYHPATGDEAIWSCQIGGSFPHGALPPEADLPMRAAVVAAYEALTGQRDGYIFSGWGGQLDESHRAVVEHREPLYESTDWATLKSAADAIEALSVALHRTADTDTPAPTNPADAGRDQS